MGARKLSYHVPSIRGYDEKSLKKNTLFSKVDTGIFSVFYPKNRYDYSPLRSVHTEFGMLPCSEYSELPNRHEASNDYRYGFNGMEKDNEVSGNGNVYDYGFRIYNPRLGKFLSMDPLTASYPWYTPYQFAGNTPVMAIDLDGKEEYIMISWTSDVGLKGFAYVREPKAKYVADKNRENNLRISILEGYIDQEEMFIENGTTKKKVGKKNIQEYKDEIAFLQQNNQDNIDEIEANYTGKILHVEKGATNYIPGHYSTKEEAYKALNNPTAYVANNPGVVTTEFTQREQLILNEGAPAVDLLTGKSYTANFNNGAAALLGDVPQNINPTFETNSSILDDAGKSELDNLYVAMLLIPDLKVNLVGHTDNVGSTGTNQTLSEDRADASKDYLISKGIDPSRITTSGAGETEPVATNDTEEGRAANRRIEIIQQ